MLENRYELNTELNGKTWEVSVAVQQEQEHFVKMIVSSRDSEFHVCLMCYFDDFGMQEWCCCVPNFDFGCKLSCCDEYWNEDQIAKYIKNKVDCRSLSTALWRVLKEKTMEQEKKIEQRFPGRRCVI